MGKIFSEATAESVTFETLIRMGYTAEEAQAILDSAPQVSSARRLLASCGVSLRRLVSEVEDDTFPTLDELEAAEGETVDGLEGVPSDDGAGADFDEAFTDETFEGDVDPVDTETIMDTLKAVSAMVDAITTIAGDEPEPMTYDEALTVVESFATEASANEELSGEGESVELMGEVSATEGGDDSDFGSFFASESDGDSSDGEAVVSDTSEEEVAVEARAVRVSHCSGDADILTASLKCSSDGVIEMLQGVSPSVFSSEAFQPASEEEVEEEEELVVTNSSSPGSSWRTFYVRPSLDWCRSHVNAVRSAFNILSQSTSERSPRFWVAVTALAQSTADVSRRLEGISRTAVKRSELWSEALSQFRRIVGREPSMMDYPMVNHLYSKLSAPVVTPRTRLRLMSRVCRALLRLSSR